jgi:hypothetical protein
MLQAMAVLAAVERSEDAAETLRRSLMAESDALLEDVERLRLEDASDPPAQLRDAIQALQSRLGRRQPPVAPATLEAAHDLVFAVQQRLMAANPNHPRPNRHAGRPGGQPIVTVVRDDRLWKVLALPAAPGGGPDDEWLELMAGTVERAWDRWCYAHQHAARAARDRVQAQAAVAVMRVAWANYWELLEEAERITRRLRARPGGGRLGAPRS